VTSWVLGLSFSRPVMIPLYHHAVMLSIGNIYTGKRVIYPQSSTGFPQLIHNFSTALAWWLQNPVNVMILIGHTSVYTVGFGGDFVW
jgi:hypothetical protein